ncbi:hypothetical protein [Candidatus Anaplasma sp. TIGMIC]|uniref:hypothetical protein n=1 Tax=Candidatus Anaplasma sp. TIGMIC TaxID=3020713 RepID=UPI00232F0F47|nr:hypothetical protein [Candidatus Anaplasma sp. TIGMIC]MDB1134978.1 hypothetical protein [Candidatus Anaplasma sp. TIGMIC]
MIRLSKMIWITFVIVKGVEMEGLSQLALGSKFGYCCKILCAVAASICVLLLFTRSSKDIGADYNAARRKERTLRNDLKAIRLKRLIMERRISDHFMLFCTEDLIDTDIPQRWFSFANCNLSQRNKLAYGSVYRVVFFLSIGAILALVIMRQLSSHNNFVLGHAASNNTVYSLAVSAFSVLIILCVAGMFLERRNAASKPADACKKLSSAFIKERKKYDGVVSSVKIYNSLPEWVRYEIRVSERFSEFIQEKILAGTLTEKVAEKVLKEVEQESLANAALYA